MTTSTNFKLHLETVTKNFFEGVELKEEQVNGLKAFYEENDLIALLPTGYGKSLIFQISPFLNNIKNNKSDSITIVLSPLNSIIKSQLLSLAKRNIAACCIDFLCKSGKTITLRDGEEECEDTESFLESKISLDRITKGDFSLVYCHPEALLSTRQGQKLQHSLRDKVCAVAIDEAHMIHEW